MCEPSPLTGSFVGPRVLYKNKEGLRFVSHVTPVYMLAYHAGCVGGPIQYYSEASHQHQPEETGATGATRSTTTSRYCGVEAYWQLEPGQLRTLVSSVS